MAYGWMGILFGLSCSLGWLTTKLVLSVRYVKLLLVEIYKVDMHDLSRLKIAFRDGLAMCFGLGAIRLVYSGLIIFGLLGLMVRGKLTLSSSVAWGTVLLHMLLHMPYARHVRKK